MLEQIFSSKTRVKLLNFFLRHPHEEYFVRQLSRSSGEFLNSVRRELENLERFGLLESESRDRKKYYRINHNFFLYPEVRSLILKAEVFLETDFIQKLRDVGTIDLLLFSGFFTGEKTSTDLLIVSDSLDKRKFGMVMDAFVRNFGNDIRFTHLTREEYLYRKEVTDTFICDLLMKKHIVLIDTIGNKKWRS